MPTARTKKTQRGSQCHPADYDHEYTKDEIEFMRAVERWQHDNGIKFPLWSDVLGIVRSLGYEKQKHQIGAFD